jgi:hypothetical protein
LSVGSLLRSVYLRYFSKPAAERAIYRAIGRRSIRSIVEIGVDLKLARRLVEFGVSRTSGSPLRYTGIDLFDSRPAEQPRLTLKQAFAALRTPNVRVQFVPGDPYTALHRVANSLAPTDLLLVGANQDAGSLARAWLWLPRMLTAESLVLLQETTAERGECFWRALPLVEVHRLAAEASKSNRRAA